MNIENGNVPIIVLLREHPILSEENDEHDCKSTSSKSTDCKRKIREEEDKPCVKRYKLNKELSPPFKLESLSDLIYIAWNYRGNAFNSLTLWKLIPSLTELNNMVGLVDFKQNIVDLILQHIQGLHISEKGEGNMLHTVLYGVPGTGKSTVAHILAKIYCNMGLLPTDNVICAKRSDFVKKYIGHSEDATSKLLESCLGGVLFIDEAYSMGNKEDADNFSKASVDLLNQWLTEHKDEFICIIAGYEEELDKCFFSINKGLKSRFPYTFHLGSYTSSDLKSMFLLKLKKNGWNIEEDNTITSEFFEKHKNSFTAYGRDIDNFITYCKTAHGRRIFGTNMKRKVLNKEDISISIEKFNSKRINKKEVAYPVEMYL